jgi:hypothetical protein
MGLPQDPTAPLLTAFWLRDCSFYGVQSRCLGFTVNRISARRNSNSPGCRLWEVNPYADTFAGPVAIVRATLSIRSSPTGNAQGSYWYDVVLQETNPATDAAINVRAPAGGVTLQRLWGGQVTRSCSGDVTSRKMSSTDAAQRSYLRTAGLYFWVINPAAGKWNGPKQIIRSGFPDFAQTYDQFGPYLSRTSGHNGSSLSWTCNPASAVGNRSRTGVGWGAITEGHEMRKNCSDAKSCVLIKNFQGPGQKRLSSLREPTSQNERCDNEFNQCLRYSWARVRSVSR